MPQTRTERWIRNSVHKKQERTPIKRGEPKIIELTEGVSVLRMTHDGLKQYVRHKNQIYEMTYVIKV